MAFGITTTGYNEKTYDDVLAELETNMRNRFGADVDLNLWSPLGMIIRSTAASMAAVWAESEANLYAAYAKTATGDNLDRIGEDRGVIRTDAVSATGTMTFTGVDATPIPAGTKVQTAGSSPVVFATTEAAAISGSTVDVAVSAVVPGIAGNVAGSTIVLLTVPISGISAVTNAAATTGGADAETDIVYRRRVLAFLDTAGKATETSNGNNVLAVTGVQAVNSSVPSLAQIKFVVDVLTGAAYDTSVSDAIKETMAQGVAASGMNAGAFDADTTIATYNGTFTDGESGEPAAAYLRVTDQAIQAVDVDVFVTYTNQDDNTAEAGIATTIPALSAVGTTVAITLNAGDTGIKDITSVRIDEAGNTGTTGDAFEIIVGSGTYPYMFIRPTQKNIDVTVVLVLTSEAPADILTQVSDSITYYLNNLGVNADVQYSDVLYSVLVDKQTGTPFAGIDTITTLTATDGVTPITAIGESITVGTQEKAVAKTISVT